MKKLLNEKWHKATGAEVLEAVKEIEGYIEKYGWQDETVMPYGRPEKIVDFIKHFKDYDKCTSGSKGIILLEINGLIDIINKWVEYEETPKVEVRLIWGKNAGTVTKMHKDTADVFIKCGMAEAI